MLTGKTKSLSSRTAYYSNVIDGAVCFGEINQKTSNIIISLETVYVT